MKRILKMLIVSAILVLSIGCISTTASAATKTSVKILKAGKSYTIKNTSKVKSSKSTVATAKKKSSTKYTITGKKKGATTLSVYNKNGKLSEKIYLLVYNGKTFKYSTNTINLAKGKTKTVKASTNKTGVKIKYASSNKNVATVSSSGKITAKKAGTATIKAKFYYKNQKVKTKKKTINVYTSSYNTDAITLTEGKTKTVSASVSSNCTAKYSNSDKSIAKVSSKGKITAVKKGTATITCKVYLGNTKVKTYNKKVTVNEASSSSSKETFPGYDYTIYLVGADKCYTGCQYCIYIKTDNPDPGSFKFSINVKSGNIMNYTTEPAWSDIHYINYNKNGWSTVEGGYVKYIATDSRAGAATIEYSIKETGNYGTDKTVASATVNFIDTEAAEEEWIDSIISKTTTSSMDSFEKMDAVRSYLVSDSAGFTYLTNMDDVLLTLTTESGPYFVTKKWDSCISPAVLVKFAEKIGGFDDIHNCYYDNSDNYNQWVATHFYCTVTIGDETKWYSVCPSSSTGAIDHIDYIDFNSTKNLTKLG